MYVPTVATEAPMIPNPNYPPMGMTDTYKQPYFSWESVTSADSYEFQLSNSKSFYSTVVSTTLTSTDYLYSSATLDYATVYFWRVRSINADGVKSDWCETQNFEVCPDC